ncbi:MAG: site-specific integrase [Desulfobacula sp.]|nr:site-specific integrase [Desulfobacula sp.]
MPYQMKNGNWKAQVRKNGKRRERTFETKKEAIAWESQLRLSEEGWEEKTGITCLLDWAEAYLDDCQERYVRKTYVEKRSAFKRLFKKIDPQMDVEKLTPAEVRPHLLGEKKTRSGYASNKDRKNLLAGWNWGIKFMNPPLPKESPFDIQKMPEERSPRYIPPEEDFWKAFEQAQGQDRVMLQALIYLACRRGELFRLKWEDVDFEKKRVRLWTRKRENGTFECEWLPMVKELFDGLSWWKNSCPVKSEFVFVCLDQKPFCIEYYGGPFKHRQHFIKRLCEKAGVKPFGFHSIRHLAASIIYGRGFSLSVIQDILRHKSPTTTNRYLKSLGVENAREALECLSVSSSNRENRENDLPKSIFGGH